MKTRLLLPSLLMIGVPLLFCTQSAAQNRLPEAKNPPKTTNALPVAPMQRRLLQVGKFNRIKASGQVVINLIGPGRQQVWLTLHQDGQNPVTMQVQNRTLMVDAPAGSRAAFNIRVSNLQGISLSGPAKIVGRDINTFPLTISVGGNSNVSLTGNPIRVSQVNATGNAKVNLRWVRSSTLGVSVTNNAQVDLAGVANVVHAKVTGNAELKAQHLRSQIVWAQTQDQGNIRIMALQRLDAFASNTSNIYYYKRPKVLNTYTKQSGNVLQWRYWS